ncbi:unnamed protein product [Paramecium primaurelia]|uniref:Uncharacterized protein n=1 Tax=Paramecium primaurelia TaxID=5886 RepID=A0A8S1QTJ9_PARPR|nr:unnamed protein product [Paramecium primaurelia]
MILLIVLVYTTHQTLIYQFHANSAIRDEWQDPFNNFDFNTCGGIQYFGKSTSDDWIVISRIFVDLEPHSHIIVDAEYLNIDYNYKPNFYIDEQYINYQSVISSSQLCGNIQFDYINTISIIRQHNRRTVWIYIAQYYAGGGLISLRLSMIKCQYDVLDAQRIIIQFVYNGNCINIHLIRN